MKQNRNAYIADLVKALGTSKASVQLERKRRGERCRSSAERGHPLCRHRGEAEALACMVEQYEMRAGLREAWRGADTATKSPDPAAVKGQPVQEQQFGSHIDSMPVEHNTPAPAGSGVVAQESRETR
jgi:hypothetical protein